jgi:hypothetical protein
MNSIEKFEDALRTAKDKGITIHPGPAAFNWVGSDNVTPIYCSGFGALILYYNVNYSRL